MVRTGGRGIVGGEGLMLSIVTAYLMSYFLLSKYGKRGRVSDRAIGAMGIRRRTRLRSSAISPTYGVAVSCDCLTRSSTTSDVTRHVGHAVRTRILKGRCVQVGPRITMSSFGGACVGGCHGSIGRFCRRSVGGKAPGSRLPA